MINEVVSRPAGRDLDNDGKSSGRDEAIELVSLANEQVHLKGATLVYRGAARGVIQKSECLKPYHAAVLVGGTTGSVPLPDGAQLARLDKTLRLTDAGGKLAVVGIAGQPLDQVAVPMAVDATAGVVTRAEDGSRSAPMVPHAELAHADGASWSIGRCANGEPFPQCVSEGVIDREAYFRDPRVP